MAKPHRCQKRRLELGEATLGSLYTQSAMGYAVQQG
jgi:hypothetical protein